MSAGNRPRASAPTRRSVPRSDWAPGSSTVGTPKPRTRISHRIRIQRPKTSGTRTPSSASPGAALRLQLGQGLREGPGREPGRRKQRPEAEAGLAFQVRQHGDHRDRRGVGGDAAQKQLPAREAQADQRRDGERCCDEEKPRSHYRRAVPLHEEHERDQRNGEGRIEELRGALTHGATAPMRRRIRRSSSPTIPTSNAAISAAAIERAPDLHRLAVVGAGQKPRAEAGHRAGRQFADDRADQADRNRHLHRGEEEGYGGGKAQLPEHLRVAGIDRSASGRAESDRASAGPSPCRRRRGRTTDMSR